MSENVGSIAIRYKIYDLDGELVEERGHRVDDVNELDDEYIVSEIGRVAMNTISYVLGLEVGD